VGERPLQGIMDSAQATDPLQVLLIFGFRFIPRNIGTMTNVICGMDSQWFATRKKGAKRRKKGPPQKEI